MSDLYSVIPGLQPTAQELLEGELLCKQILEAKFPDLDLREGTALRDLVIRPGAMLFALMNKAGEYYFTQNTLSNIDNVTPTEVLDSILSNWFLTRNVGIRSVINARLYFARSKNITVSSSIYFSTDNVTKFFPADSFSFPAEALILDSYSNEYYIDMDMVAEREGTAYNISSGSLLYFQNFDPYFLRAEINYLKSESISTETNLEFISRSKTAISTRNLINVPSIDSNLRAEFNFITRLLTIGMGDPEMLRDVMRSMLEQTYPITVTSAVKGASKIDFKIPNHNFETGQPVRITDCVPAAYAIDTIVTKIDRDNFYVNMFVPDAGPVLNNPKVQAINNPVLIHNGGMVDIFCSEKLATSSVQLTADPDGKIDLTGPIYKFSRATLSAGDGEDTIPLKKMMTVVSREITPTGLIITTGTPHMLVTGDPVRIDKVVQNKPIFRILYTGLTATALCTNNGYKTGDIVTISNAIPEAYNGTFTVTEGGLAVGAPDQFKYTLNAYQTSTADGPGMIANVNIWNGTRTATVINPNTFSIDLGRSTTGYTVDLFASMEVYTDFKYTVTNPNSYTVNTELVRITNGVLSIKSNGGLYAFVGRYVVLYSPSTPSLNGTYLVDTLLNSTTITCKVPNMANTSVIRDCTLTMAAPWNDVGFSQKQNLILDFGQDQAGKTASFNIDYFQNLDSIQTYLELPSNRVLCADYLAKGFNFYKVSVEVTSYNSSIPDESLVENIIKNYLAGLGLGGTFIMSDMMTQLRINGVVNIQNPPKVTFERYTRDLIPVEYGTIKDIMDPKDRTSVFLLDSVSTFAQNLPTTNNSAIIL